MEDVGEVEAWLRRSSSRGSRWMSGSIGTVHQDGMLEQGIMETTVVDEETQQEAWRRGSPGSSTGDPSHGG